MVQPTLDVSKPLRSPSTPVTGDPLALPEVEGVVAVPNISNLSHFHRQSPFPNGDPIHFDPGYT